MGGVGGGRGRSVEVRSAGRKKRGHIEFSALGHQLHCDLPPVMASTAVGCSEEDPANTTWNPGLWLVG